MVNNSNAPRDAAKTMPAITQVTVGGFKSIAEETTIKIRPLTVLAGANSSGKSSIMQPLLLLKQTLEAPYDPGPLLLNGPNVKFNKLNQLLSFTSNAEIARSKKSYVVGVHFEDSNSYRIQFDATSTNTFRTYQEYANLYGDELTLQSDMTENELLNLLDFNSEFVRSFGVDRKTLISAKLIQDRFHLRRKYEFKHNRIISSFTSHYVLSCQISNILHVPGMRIPSNRLYNRSSAGPEYIGTFDNYFASIIENWAINQNKELTVLQSQLLELGLTSIVQAQALDATQIEVQVGRTLHSTDTVNIADVGLGVSQVLPVLVALLVAVPGQMVYIDQPELHLHPRAQVRLAKMIADAAKRGVRVVIETHSSLLLTGIQSLVAEDYLPKEDVILHWFNRDEHTGYTKVTSAELDEAGRFGDWPEDFDDVTLQAQAHYLKVAEAKMMNSAL